MTIFEKNPAQSKKLPLSLLITYFVDTIYAPRMCALSAGLCLGVLNQTAVQKTRPLMRDLFWLKRRQNLLSKCTHVNRYVWRHSNERLCVTPSAAKPLKRDCAHQSQHFSLEHSEHWKLRLFPSPVLVIVL
jgi:hypothetical protein